MKAWLCSGVFLSCSLAIFTAVMVFVPINKTYTTDSPIEMAIAEEQPAKLESAVEQTKPISILFLGDIMLGRHVETLMNTYGPDYPFEKIDEFLSSKDYIFANLEGPIVHDHHQTPNGGFSFSFKDSVGELLKKHGIDAVSLANNHALNQGADGFVETQSILDGIGIAYAGHPLLMDESYTEHLSIEGKPFTFAAFNMTFPQNNPDAAVATIERLAGKSGEPIIVMMHWGQEYQTHSDVRQQTLAHRLIDAGADLIIGAHPHVVQESEEYHDKMIFYSLGNFIFDQYWSTETQKGLAVELTIDDGEWKFTTYPLQSILSQPMIAP